MRLGLLGSLFGLYAGAASVYFVVLTVAGELPSDLKTKFLQDPPEASLVYADDGQLIGEFHRGNRQLLGLDNIPPQVQGAFISAEDGNFWRHPGFDLRGIVRAAYTNYRRGRASQGASTITQQVTKIILLREKFYKEKRDYTRKLDELVMSVRLERELAKREILEIYLNLVFLGRNAYGVAAAADAYFAKDIAELTVAEAAYLASLVQGPSVLSRDMAKARKRQVYVIGRMREEGYITAAQKREALEENLVFINRESESNTLAPQFVEDVRRWAVERYGNTRVLTGGLRIHTTLSITKQQAAEEAVATGVEDVARRLGFSGPLAHVPEDQRMAFAGKLKPLYKRDDTLAEISLTPLASVPYRGMLVVERRKYSVRLGEKNYALNKDDTTWLRRWEYKQRTKLRTGDVIAVRLQDDALSVFQPPTIDSALVSMETSTGRVVAMVGGYQASPLNLASQARRQVGSSIKPFIYLTALESGYTPTTQVLDAPIVLRFGAQAWAPKNYDNRYRGQVTLRYALSKSLNTVSVRILAKLGVDRLVDTLRRVGITREIPRDLSVALGSIELTPLELAGGYLVIASGGRAVRPRLVDFVTDSDGNVIDDFRRPTLGRAIAPGQAFVLTDMLQEVVRSGTARRARVLDVPAAGKTGTTNDYRDAWFNGFTPALVTGVWVGRRGSNTSIGDGATGGNTALPIWIRYNERAHRGMTNLSFTPPEDVWLLNFRGKLTPFVRGTVERALTGLRPRSARSWRSPWPPP